MSVFAGVIRWDGAAADRSDLEELGATADAAATVWLGGQAGLLHAVEGVGAETPEGVQPLADASTGALIVFDGRLDDRDVLVEALGAGHAPFVANDAALALAAYGRWGESAPAHLTGDFAFAVWDPRMSRVLIARDPVGARTVYYSSRPGVLRFASTLEQLLRSSDIPHELDDEAVARFLYGDDRPISRNGYYRHIELLRGGHTLTASGGGAASIARYWSWPDTAPARRPLTPADDALFRERFFAAVEDRLRSDAPVGVMVSGGLDSGAVAAVAGALHEKRGVPRIHAYPIVFDTERFQTLDERRYSAAVIERYRLPGRNVIADEAWPLRFIADWLPSFSEPVMAPFDGALHLPLAAARADGVRTMMMGHLGDLVVAGSPLWFKTLLRPSRVQELGAEVRAHAARHRTSVARAFLATVAFRLLPAGVQQRIEYRRRPDYGRWLPAAVRRRYEIDLPAPAYSGRDAWWRQLRDSVALVGQGRSGYFDRMFRHFGVEQRQPFLDTRLLTAILSFPPQAFYSRGQHKRILRTSLSDVLPPLVRDREDKASFAPLAEFGLRGPYRPYVEELTRSSELVAAGLVREAPWQESIASFLDGDVALGWVPWRSLTLEMWLRRRAGRLPPV